MAFVFKTYRNLAFKILNPLRVNIRMFESHEELENLRLDYFIFRRN